MLINSKATSVYALGRTEGLYRYLCSIKPYQPLDFKTENEYITRYKVDGDLEARDMLIKCNQRFIYSAAKRYSSNPDTVMDLVEEGNLALIEAIDRFDFTKENRLLTYAEAFIWRNMNNYFCDNKLVQRPSDKKIGSRVRNERRIFYSVYQREPSIDELKEILYKKYGVKVLYDGDLSVQSVNHIDDIVSNDGNDYKIADTDEYMKATSSRNDYEKTIDQDNSKALVLSALSKLPQRTSDIIKLRYGIDHDREYSSWEIAEMYGMTTTRINQIINGATKSLEYMMTA